MAKPTPMSGFEELEAMIDEGMAAKREAEAASKARERLVKGVGTSEQIAEDAALVRAWEIAHDYRSAGLAALFIEQECASCGDCQYLFEGLFERREHRTQANVRRWERVPEGAMLPTIKREIMKQYRSVPFCGECCEREGFSFLRSYYDDGMSPDAALMLCDAAIRVLEEQPMIAPGVPETPWPFPKELAA